MRSLVVGWFFCAMLASSFWARAQDSAAADRAFKAAGMAFQDRQWDRAERELGAFAARYPESPRVPEVILRQAQARYELKRFQAAADLLALRLPQAGGLGDQYRFWMGEAHFQRGALASAADAYAELVAKSPESPLRLQASYSEAFARFQLGQIDRAVGLLRQPDGVFQRAAAENSKSDFAVRGQMLLAEALQRAGDYAGAAQVLAKLGELGLEPALDWRRQFLLAMGELAAQRTDAAMGRTTNLFNIAVTAADPLLQARSLKLHAEILERSQKPAEAIQIYDRLAQLRGAPPVEAREARLKAVNLAVAHTPITNAIVRLESFLVPGTTNGLPDSALDLMHFTLGELHLRHFREMAFPSGSLRSTVATNALFQARSRFDLVINSFTNSPLVGKALLNRGWVLWEEAQALETTARVAESLVAFQAATERLPKSEDQAVARFKWADCQFLQRNFSNALENYRLLLKTYADMPAVTNKLFDQTLYQVLRASIETRDLEGARTAKEQVLAAFPKSPVADRSLLMFGQALLDQGRLAEAREAFADFLKRFANSSLRPEAELDLARAYAQELNWMAAIEQYSRWLQTYTNHPARAQTEFDRAWANYLSGNQTNALMLFTNLVAEFPASRLAPVAQLWVGDYYFNQADYVKAELNYLSRTLVQNTNAPSPELTYQARLMAARAAFLRQGYSSALRHVTALISDAEQDTNAPPSLLPRAYFLFGEIRLDEPGSTNAMERYTEALKLFSRIPQLYPTNDLVPAARGYMGNCYLQLASNTPERYRDATNEYRRVIDAPNADVSARSMAEVGIGTVLEKLADDKSRPAENQHELLETAVDHYLNVVYGKNVQADKGEQPDLYWVSRAGLAAGRLLAERLARVDEALRLYERLLQSLPDSTAEVVRKKIEALGVVPAGGRG